MFQRSNYEPGAYDDDWEDAPGPGALRKFGGGILLAGVVIAYGIYCIASGHGFILGNRSGSLEVFGSKSVALGWASINLGMFLHCHYFWGAINYSGAMAVLGKIVSASGFIISMGYLLWNVGVLGRVR